MKKFKFILLILSLFIWFSGSAQCFNMTVTPAPSTTNSECYNVSIDLIGGVPVQISDEIHPDVVCSSSCNFVWCYESDSNGVTIYSIQINCRAIAGPSEELGCRQKDGCIVVIGNG